MQVTERIHVEDIGETWCQAQVLEETRKHVPGVSLRYIGVTTSGTAETLT